MLIKNGLVYCSDDGFIKGSIVTADKLIDELYLGEALADLQKSYKEDGQVIDAEGLYVIPGLTDIHFHGCAGYDFCQGDMEAIEKIAEYQLANGVTTICPASMSFDETKLKKVFSAARAYDNKNGAELVGINMEGPFISLEKKGAQNEDYITCPDVGMFHRLQEAAGGMIKLVDIAPEACGAMEFIGKVANEVHVSIAHTNADYETTMKAFDMGADHVTHLYNAMTPFHSRKPGVIGAASDYENAYIEIIGDGVHCHESVLRATFKMIGNDRLVLISDSMEACGMADGEYELGGQSVIVRENLATLKDGTIAGSVTNLMDCVRVAVNKAGIALEDAIKCAAVNSAKSIGIYDMYGSLNKGKRANIVILDRELSLRYVIKDGELKHCF